MNLDMRFDITQKTNAFNIINETSSNELKDIIYNYGEERRSHLLPSVLQ